MRTTTTLLAIAALAVVPAMAKAQDTKQPVRRRQEPIQIRGQVPTPQVVTVRPREVPTYSRQVLYPRFYDHDFWPAILPAYQLMAKRQLTGAVPVDSATMRADSAALRGTGPSAPVAPAAPGDTVRQRAPVTVPDTTAKPSGTPPARTSR